MCILCLRRLCRQAIPQEWGPHWLKVVSLFQCDSFMYQIYYCITLESKLNFLQ